MNSSTGNFWREGLLIGPHHSLTPVLGDELCSFGNNRPFSEELHPEPGWWKALPPLHSCLSLFKFTCSQPIFFPRFGISTSKAHLEKTKK